MDILFGHYPLLPPLLVSMGVSMSFPLLIMWACLVRIKKQHSKQIKKLESIASVITSGSHGMGQKILALEQKFNRLCETQDEMKSSDVDFSYTQAQKLITQGVDSQVVAANSGLSFAEINLMRLLYHQERNACDYTHA